MYEDDKQDAPYQGFILPVSGPPREITVRGLKDLQDAVGGYIEAIDLGRAGSMYINEEGKLIDLPRNHFAEDVCGVLGHPEYMGFWDFIAGDAVVVGPVDPAGYDTDITDVARVAISRVAIER